MRWRLMSKFSFDPKGSSIILNAFLYHRGFQKIVRLVLDTGSTYLTLTPEVAVSLGIELDGVLEKNEMINICGVESVPMINLDLVRVGNKEARMVKTLIHSLPPQSYVDGLLGLSFLRNFNLKIDFKNGWLEME